MDYLREGTPLGDLLLKSDKQMQKCYLVISAIRYIRGLSAIPDPFGTFTLNLDEIQRIPGGLAPEVETLYYGACEGLQQIIPLLSGYNESDLNNIYNICLTIWYLAKIKVYNKGIDIFRGLPNYDVANMERLADERTRTKLAVFNDNFDFSQMASELDDDVIVVG
jgi:hypothetical protein